MPDADVIVVGAGPAGLLVAAEAASGGADVLVVERHGAPTGESRASILHARTMQLLADRGVLDRLGPLAEAGPGHFGGIPLDLHAADPDHPYAGQWHCLQSRLEPVLQQWAVACGVRVWRGCTLTAVHRHPDGVTAVVTGDRGSRRLTGRYLAGCDGTDSTVRRLLHWPMAGQSATRYLLRADVDGLDIPDRKLRRYPGGTATAARRPEGHVRLMIHQRGLRPPAPGGTPTYGEVARAWAAVTGEDIRAGQPLWLNGFDDASLQAVRYRDGRVLLAGDAAHVQLPVGGQALNLGLQDATELGARLAARVTGAAGDDVLDGYHRVRHPAGARTLAGIRAQTGLLFGDARSEPVRAILTGLLGVPAARRHLARMISALDTPVPPPRPYRKEGITMDRLSGKTALVTGSSRGIGRATAVRLAREGALVIVHYATGEAAATETVELIEKEGGRAFAVRAPLGVAGDVHELFLGLEQGLKERTGETTLDILVNNAAVTTPTGTPPEDITPEEFDRYLAVNAKAPFFIVQRALALMPRGGRIINVSSGLTRCANPDQAVYSMTKGAIEQMSLHLARHLGPRGITVNSVAPGITDNGSPVFGMPEVVAQMAQLSAFGRVGDAGDVADVITFLATDEARWITGAFIDASGGTLLGQR